MQIPIGMIITSVMHINESKAQLFGFWYYKDLYVPQSQEEKQKVFSDLLFEKCKQLKIIGSLAQISDILMQADRFQSLDEDANKLFTILIDKLEDSPNTSIAFDDVMNPKGTGLAIDTVCEFDETIDSIRNKIFANTDFIELQLSENWTFFNL
jgi:two-component SAPR family response regulator